MNFCQKELKILSNYSLKTKRIVYSELLPRKSLGLLAEQAIIGVSYNSCSEENCKINRKGSAVVNVLCDTVASVSFE